MRVQSFLVVALLPLTAASRFESHETGSSLETSEHAIEPEITFDKMSSQILKCIDPRSATNENGARTEVQRILERLRLEEPSAAKLQIDGWKNRPFASMKGSSILPAHMVIGLVHNATKYTDSGPTSDDSDCFEFEYDNPSAQSPHGCRVFEKSFQPLQELRQCIVKHLEHDSIWTTREESAWEAVKNQDWKDVQGFENASYKDWCANAVYSHTSFLGVNIPVKICSTTMDTKRRAEEMIKFTLFKKDSNTQPQDVPRRVNAKIQQTSSWPGMKQGGQQSVSDATMKSISKECFKVHNDNKEESYHFLQDIGMCLPLMYDKTEVGDGFGFQDAFLKLSKLSNYGPPVSLQHHITYDVPPVCGRMALAALPNIQSARYHVTPSAWGAIRGDEHTPWSDCMHPDYINCRKAYFCWEKALNWMCGIDVLCCPGGGIGDEEKYARHHACMAGQGSRCADMRAP